MASTVWRGFISFGLVSVPVRLFRAARAERVSLRRLYRAQAPGSSYSRASDDDEVEEEAPPPASTQGRRKFEPVLATPSQNSRLSATARAAPAPEPALAPVRQVSVRGETDDVITE